MPRLVDPKRTRKALRKVRQLSALVAKPDAPNPDAVDYSGWEREFLHEVEDRLDKFGSAFADPAKGSLDEALSLRQAQKLKELAAKAKQTGKEPAVPQRNGLRTRKPMQRGKGFGKSHKPRSDDDEA
jgi:hypothetical protein